MDTVVKEYHLRNPEKDAMTYINALKREEVMKQSSSSVAMFCLQVKLSDWY